MPTQPRGTRQDDSKPSGNGRGLSRKGVATRARLLTAAQEVFRTKPYAEARITDITAAAQVASGSFYTYFDSKEEIFREVATQALAALRAASTVDPDNVERDPLRDLRYSIRQFFLECSSQGMVLRSIEQLTTADAGISGRRHSSLVLSGRRAERWIRRLQERGVCDPSLDPWMTAVALQAMTISMGYDHLVWRDEPVDLDALVTATAMIWAKTTGLA